VFQNAATQLNNRGGVAEFSYPAKRLDERISLFNGLLVRETNKWIGQSGAPLPTRVGLIETTNSSL
jgi:hypothetical protein